MSFDIEKAKAQVELATQSAKDQIEANKQSLVNNLDAADRIVMRKAAETVLTLAPVVAANPI